MSTALYGIIEIVIFFGGVMGFALYQLWAIKKINREDREARARGEDPAERERGKNSRTREDVFWDTITKPRPPAPPRRDPAPGRRPSAAAEGAAAVPATPREER
ncbi:MAG: hypothetical protein AAFU72_14415 [Pseudomonadota bacterium]